MTRNKYLKKFCSIFLTIVLITSGVLFFSPINPENSSVSAASTWTETSDRDFSNGNSTNLTIVGAGENAELQINISDLHHWQFPSPGSSPSSKAYHGMATINNDDKVVIFGGGWNVNDTWEYDLSANTWVEKSPTTKPGGRYYTSMAAVDGQDKAVVFGGYGWTGSAYAVLDDTWEYDSSDGEWVDKTGSTTPAARYSHSMATIDSHDKVMLFGGYSYSGGWTFYDDTWIFDSSDGTWTEKYPSTAPAGRSALNIASIWGTDKVLLFGGMTSWNNYVSDTWIYDLSDNIWTKKTPSASPSARGYHSMATIYGTDKVVIFGGMPSWNNYLDDTWVYDLSDDTWTKIVPRNSANKPKPSAGCTMAMVDGQDNIVHFGGITTGNSYLSDTWKYKQFLPPRNGTYISNPHDTGSESAFKQISWFANIPDDTNISIQLRSASDESSLTTKDFIGLDGTTSSYYTRSPKNIWSGHDGDRWIQYKAYLNIDVVKESPSLKEVVITYNCLPCTIVVGPTDGSLLALNKPTFSWTFIDNDSINQKSFQVQIAKNITFEEISFDTGEQTTEEQAWEFPTGTSYTEIPDGTWYWRVRTKDIDGAWTEYSAVRKLVIDTQTPSSSPTIPINDGFYQSLTKITGLASDPTPGSRLNIVEITIKRLSDNFYWNGETWVPLVTWLNTNGYESWSFDSSSIPWSSSKKYNIQSRAMDKAGNIELPGAGNIFIMDMERPYSNINFPSESKWLSKLDMILGSSADVGGAGVSNVKISIKRIKDNNYWYGKGWIAGEQWLSTTGTNNWQYNSTDIPWITGESYLIKSKAYDNIDNVESPGLGITFKYDDRAPKPVSILINNDDEFTTSTTVTLSLGADDFGSGTSKMSFSFDGKEWTDWEKMNTTIEYTIPSGDGEKMVYYRVMDLAGNIAEPVYDKIILDSTPPEQLSIKINNDEKYTSSNVVSLEISAVDKLSGLSDISFSFDGNNWLSWERYKTSRTITLPTKTGDGEKRVYFMAIDNAGNTAEAVFDSIILDTTPPYSLSNIINNGAEEVNTTWVILSLNAEDLLSGVDKISFSTDGNNWSGWEDFIETKTYLLSSGNGPKTIYIRVKDLAGNIAEPVSSTIRLNITQPVVEKETQPPLKEKSEQLIDTWLLLLILIVIIIALIVASFAVIVKRKKREQQKQLTAGALVIKPGGLEAPVISYGKFSGQEAFAQLQGSRVGQATGVHGQIAMLPKSTQYPQPAPQAGAAATAQPQPVPQLPALPPARVSTPTASSPRPSATTTTAPGAVRTPTQAGPQSQAPTQTPSQTVSITRTTTPSQQQSEEQKTKGVGPTVHLPYTSTQPQTKPSTSTSTIPTTGRPQVASPPATTTKPISTTPQVGQQSTGQTKKKLNNQ